MNLMCSSIFRYKMLGSDWCMGLYFVPIELRMMCANEVVGEEAWMLG